MLREIRPVGVGLLVSVFLLTASIAQQSGTTGGKATLSKAPVRVNPNPTNTPQTIYYMGKVVMDTGMEPPAPVGVLRVCNGNSHREAFTSNDGSFSFVVGDRSISALADASDDTRPLGADSQYSRRNRLTSLILHVGLWPMPPMTRPRSAQTLSIREATL